MRHALVRLLTAAAVAAPLPLVAQAPAATRDTTGLPAASLVLGHYLTAIGGRDALRSVNAMRMTATLEIPAMGLQAPMEVIAARPNRMATRSSIPGLGDMRSGFDGTVGWTINPVQGPALLEGKALEQAREESDFQNSERDPSLYRVLETKARTTYAGEPAYELHLVRKSGRETTEYYSVASGYLIGVAGTQESAMGSVPVTTTFGGYTRFGRLMLPTKQTMQAGPQQMVSTTTAVSFDPIPDSAFALPAEIRALRGPASGAASAPSTVDATTSSAAKASESTAPKATTPKSSATKASKKKPAAKSKSTR